MTRRNKFCLPSQNITPAMSLLYCTVFNLTHHFVPKIVKLKTSPPNYSLYTVLYTSIVSSPLVYSLATTTLIYQPEEKAQVVTEISKATTKGILIQSFLFILIMSFRFEESFLYILKKLRLRICVYYYYYVGLGTFFQSILVAHFWKLHSVISQSQFQKIQP
jgi:hypothetical protein